MIHDDECWLMMVDDDEWWLQMINDNEWWLMMINDDEWWLMMINNDEWWLQMINDNEWWFMMINDDESCMISRYFWPPQKVVCVFFFKRVIVARQMTALRWSLFWILEHVSIKSS